jgi:antitoxin HigA-1
MLGAGTGFRSGGASTTQSKSVSSASARRRSGRSSVAEPITPGRFLRKRILDPEGLTQSDLAASMGVSRLTINEIANDRRAVTAEMALRLEAVTRVSALLWLNLQRAVELHRAKVNLADVLPRLVPITRRREFVDLHVDPEAAPDPAPAQSEVARRHRFASTISATTKKRAPPERPPG